MIHRYLRAAVAAAAVAAVLAPGAAAQAAAPITSYVALGDSYASGAGAPPYYDPACERTDNSYPELLAAEKNVTDFRFPACGGATTADVATGQVESLTRRTKLVTLTVGGNDLGFGSGITTCLVGTDADCLAVTEAAKTFSTETLPGRLDSVYTAIRQRAPKAKVVVTGYVHFFETGPDCAAVPPATLVKREALNSAVDTLNRTVAQRAARAGARYVDVQPAFAGHGLCGADPWLTGLAGPSAFHPNAAGYLNGYFPAVREASACR